MIMSLYVLFSLHLGFVEKIYPGKCHFLNFCYFDVTEALWKKMMYVCRIQNKYKKIAFT